VLVTIFLPKGILGVLRSRPTTPSSHTPSGRPAPAASGTSEAAGDLAAARPGAGDLQRDRPAGRRAAGVAQPAE
jgi:hypothetical protein